MRLISFILILLMLAMVAAPCGDAVETDQRQQTEQATESTSHSYVVTIDADIHLTDDVCSPICPCQCCPSTASDVTGMAQHAATIPLFLSSDYKERLSSPFLMLVWSPPQPAS